MTNKIYWGQCVTLYLESVCSIVPLSIVINLNSFIKRIQWFKWADCKIMLYVSNSMNVVLTFSCLESLNHIAWFDKLYSLSSVLSNCGPFAKVQFHMKWTLTEWSVQDAGRPRSGWVSCLKWPLVTYGSPFSQNEDPVRGRRTLRCGDAAMGQEELWSPCAGPLVADGWVPLVG